MSEQQQTVEEMQAELITLRRTNAELLQKSRDRKTRNTELEAELAAGKAKVNELILNRPVKQLASSISKSPETLIASLANDYRFELEGEEVVLRTLDGKPVMHEGKAVPFEAEAIKKMLFATDDVAKKTLYDSILIASRASGASSVARSSTAHAAASPKIHFGLR